MFDKIFSNEKWWYFLPYIINSQNRSRKNTTNLNYNLSYITGSHITYSTSRRFAPRNILLAHTASRYSLVIYYYIYNNILYIRKKCIFFLLPI